jgi:hypothetical protein
MLITVSNSLFEKEKCESPKKNLWKSSCEFVSTMNTWKNEFKSHPNEVFIDASKMC